MAFEIITGEIHIDERGELLFFNNFVMTAVKRFYKITHFDTEAIRAWQGHRVETKWFYAVKGVFKIVITKPDDWINPSDVLDTQIFNIEAKDDVIVKIPGGYINGFKAMVPDSQMIIFSDCTLKESENDTFRFNNDRWYNWNS